MTRVYTTRDVRDYTLFLSAGEVAEGVRVGSNGRGERPHNGPFRRTAREGAARAAGGGWCSEKDRIYFVHTYIFGPAAIDAA